MADDPSAAGSGDMPDAPPARRRSRSWVGLSDGESELDAAKSPVGAGGAPAPVLRPTYTPEQRAHHRRLARSVLGAWFCACGLMFAVGYVNPGFVVFNFVAPSMTRLFWGGYDGLDESKLKQGLWVNTMASALHSAVAAVLSIIVMIDYLQHGNSLLDPPTWSVLPRLTVAISLGYFGYDTYDMIQTGLYVKSMHIIVHHFTMCLVFGLGLFLDHGPLYLVYTLVCEINSLFLHLRTLMGMADLTMRHFAYRLVWALLWISFVTTRLIGHGYLVFYLIGDWPNWNSGLLFGTGMGCLIVFNFLNLQLLSDVFVRFTKDRQAVSGKRKSH